MSYASQFVRYERVGDKVTPVRVRKEWVEGSRGRKFLPVRLTMVGFPAQESAPEDWRSTPPPAPVTRDSLLVAGLLKPAGYGELYLAMGAPSEWSDAVANGPDAWVL